ncbi:MAG: LamG-like jellyroll fold domain-containing protein, partial [Lentisphaerota bacterium]
CDLGALGIKTGDWFHVAITYGDKVEIYVNGELRASASKTDTLKHALMKDLNLFSNVDGAVDEVRIYNKALDAATLKKIYETATKP